MTGVIVPDVPNTQCHNARTSRTRLRPCGSVQAMVAEQRKGQPFQPEADAGRVCQLPRCEPQRPDLAEMIEVAVEAGAGGGARRAVDGDQQFELELLGALAIREHAPGATEERIVGDIDLEGQGKRGHHRTGAAHPCLAEPS